MLKLVNRTPSAAAIRDVQIPRADVTEVTVFPSVTYRIDLVQFPLAHINGTHALRPSSRCCNAARSPSPPSLPFSAVSMSMSTNNYTDPSQVSQATCNTNSHDETSTLLNHEQTPSLESQSTKNTPKTPTPLPYAQLACLCLVRTAEPINFTHIFPYVNQMLAGMHVTDDPSRIGFYSGVVESAFAVAQLCSIYQWARLSGMHIRPFHASFICSVFLDVIGRKPVILG